MGVDVQKFSDSARRNARVSARIEEIQTGEWKMTAAEWNAKHPIGTRVLVFSRALQRSFPAFVIGYEQSYVLAKRHGFDDDSSGWHYENVEPISAYPGDMYEGKPLKKVRME